MRSCGWVALALVALGLGAGPGRAADEPRVKVTVLAVLATGRDKVVEEKVACIAREVQKIDPHLTGFRLARVTSESVPVGVRHNFPLAEGQVATVLIEHAADAQNRVRLKVKPPQVGEIGYTSACGKFFPIVTRYQTKAKDRLIIAVMVRPCPGK